MQLQLLLGHRRVEQVRYLGIEIDEDRNCRENRDLTQLGVRGGSIQRPTIKSVETGAMYERSSFKGGHPMNT